MVDFHHGINTLERLARSPRMFRLFSKELKVLPLAKLETHVELPGDVEGWREVLEKAMLYATRTAVPDSEEILQKAAKRFPVTSRKCPIHCEVSIIEHFSTPRTPPPINYIGVSKLSCAACTAVIKQWRAASSAQLADAASSAPPTSAASLTQFGTKGSSGKWYFGWGFPTSTNMQHILDSVYRRASDIFGERMHSAGYAGRKSSESDCSADSDDGYACPLIIEHAPEGFFDSIGTPN